MIIGVTGTIGSGKGEFSKMLEGAGFTRLVFGDVVREEAESKGLDTRRDTLQSLGYSYRVEMGVGVWARRLIDKIKNGSDYVVDGFRYPDQVEEFRKMFSKICLNDANPQSASIPRPPARMEEEDIASSRKNGFALVAVDALGGKRYERLKARGREGDPQTIEEFTDMDERDWVGYRAGNGQDTRGCFEMARYRVHNNGSLDLLRRESQNMLGRMRRGC